MRRRASSNAATGAPSDSAVTVKPAGAADTESPCDIQTLSSAGMPAKSAPASTTRRCVPPNSLSPVLATAPPRACAIAWNP
jgi:hypothetical protein